MSNHLAIATVTASLRRMLQGVVASDLSGASVTTVRPTESGAGLPQTGVNVFLYLVTPNPDLRNVDLPTRRSGGSGIQRPTVALDLYYFFSFYGDQSTLEPQRLLGIVVRTLHARPILTRDTIRDTLADPAFGFLVGSDLADEVELVRLTPLGLDTQGMSQLWNGPFQKADYALSVAYRASTVLLTADERPSPALPVREWRLLVETLRQPVVESVDAGGAGEPLITGSSVRLRGQRLQGKITRVRLAGREIEPSEVSDTEIRFPLDAPAVDPLDLRAGVQGVQVVHPFLMGDPPEPRAGVESNVAPLVLRPQIVDFEVGPVAVSGGLASAEVTVWASPRLGARQRAFLLLNTVPGSPVPAGGSFPLQARAEDTDAVSVLVDGLIPGRYLVRLQVDGAESPLLLDTDPASPGFGGYSRPAVDLTGGDA